MRTESRGRTTAALLAGMLLCAASGTHAESAPPAGSQLRVVVCSSHHHVLRHWLRAAQEGRIPDAGVTVVHFDAHPDLAVPSAPVSRSWREQPDRLVAATDIASFQLAAAWVGLVSDVIWLRPLWAHQIPDGTRRFRLGALPNGRLRVDDPADYYVLDEGWAPTASLRGALPFRLRVLTLADAAQGALEPSGAAILDIDLDGYATRNPSADRLRSFGVSDAELDQVRAAFAPDKLRLGATPEERIAGLERLVGAVATAADGSWRSQLLAAWTLWRGGLGLRDLWNVARLLAGPAADLPLEVLLEDGRYVVGAPEFSPDPAELERSAGQLAALLAAGTVRPQLVTVARSVGDGFTPRPAWPAAERRTLEVLRRELGPIEVVYDRGLRPAP